MNETILEVIPVYDLLGKNFFVPSYQRGFRWTEQQVNELLEDIWEFSNIKNKSENEFYCLQPIVIKECDDERKRRNNLDGTWYEVIDGQQRLTTLTILLRAIVARLNALGDQTAAKALYDNVIEGTDNDGKKYFKLTGVRL